MGYFEGMETVIIVVAVVCGIYYFLLHRMGILKPAVQSNASVADASPKPAPNILPIIGAAHVAQEAMALPPSSETPQVDWNDLEMKEEDDSNILLKEAEKIVERIQDTINHIASNPPNHEEVTSKIHALVSPYQIFLDTEYYDSINTYIALAVQRDCSIQLTPDQLKALWN